MAIWKEILLIIISILSACGLIYSGIKKIVSDLYLISTEISQTKELIKIIHRDVDLLNNFDRSADTRLRNIENFLNKTTDFTIR